MLSIKIFFIYIYIYIDICITPSALNIYLPNEELISQVSRQQIYENQLKIFE